MKLDPIEGPRDDDFKRYRNLERECDISTRDRAANALRQRSTFLTGTEQGSLALYNRLGEWVRWSTGNLYTPDLKWDVTIPLHYGEKYLPWCEAAREHFTRYWRESGAGLMCGLGVRYAHVWDGAPFKVIAQNNLPVPTVLNPGELGVLRESVPSLERQEALCHYFELDLNAFDRLIEHLPDKRRLELQRAAASAAAPTRGSADTLPPTVSNIIVSGASPNPLAAGSVTSLPFVATAVAREQEPVVRLSELWVKDDDNHCWRKVLMLRADHEGIISEVSMKRTYGETHAFHLLVLDEVTDYLWGWSPMDPLIGLQIWRERRMGDIDLAEQLRLQPPLLFSGISGVTEEVVTRFRAPGGWAGSSLPNADVKPIAPQPMAEPFALVKEVDMMFDRQAGMTRSGAGEGQPNVRSGEQEFALGAMAAPRMIEAATRVESLCSDIGTQMLRMLGKVEDLTLRTAEGEEFLLDQLNELHPEARVLHRSASPVYTQQMLTRTVLAHKAGAIDDEDLIDGLDLPRSTALKAKARKRHEMKAKQAEAEQKMQEAEVSAKTKKAEADAVRAAKA